ncbi:MAG: S1C family serine protease [Deltaproteobacteria bacterium]
MNEFNYGGFSNNNESKKDNNNSPFYYNDSRKKTSKNNLWGYIITGLASSVIGGLIVGAVLVVGTPIMAPVVNQTAGTLFPGITSKVLNGLDKTATLVKKVEVEKTTSPVVGIAEKVGPSIVGIKVIYKVNDPFAFFGDAESEAKGEGSGIIVRKDGCILTNYHVIESAYQGGKQTGKVEVYLPNNNKKPISAKIIGGDAKTDLAVVKIDQDNLPVAEFGDSSQVKVGELAVAIGNPLGMEFAGSVTAGVISAVNRTIDIDEKTLNLIQTDAAINPGNSGGALVNSAGKVIGINTIKIGSTGVEGLGFAIPINEVKPIMEELIKYTYVKRPLFGIGGVNIDEKTAQQYGLPIGVYVNQVTQFSGAERGGIQVGDVIVEFGGKQVKTIQEINDIKKKYKVGDSVKVTIIRDSQKKTLSIKLTEER